jgi:hypothetical protein
MQDCKGDPAWLVLRHRKSERPSVNLVGDSGGALFRLGRQLLAKPQRRSCYLTFPLRNAKAATGVQSISSGQAPDRNRANDSSEQQLINPAKGRCDVLRRTSQLKTKKRKLTGLRFQLFHCVIHMYRTA